MSRIAVLVMAKVNAPYAQKLTAQELASHLADDPEGAARLGQVYSFFTELPAEDQTAFLKAFGVDPLRAQATARQVGKISGQALPLGR
jgi:hypothetical protein